MEIGGFDVFVDDDYGPDIVSALEHGDYEGNERYLAGRLIRRDDRVIDIGTGIGLVAMTAARIAGAGSVLTFEANPDIARDAQDNFRRNGLDGIRGHVGILRRRQAITDPNATANFHVDKAFWGSRLNASPEDDNIVRSVQVPVFCLENAIEEHRATALICDIEGAEVELLAGADLSAIRLIILETHYWVAGKAATDGMLHQLTTSGFSIQLMPMLTNPPLTWRSRAHAALEWFPPAAETEPHARCGAAAAQTTGSALQHFAVPVNPTPDL